MKIQVQFDVDLDRCATEAEARRRWADVLSGMDRMIEASQNFIYSHKQAADINDTVSSLYAASVTVDAPTSCGALHPSQRGGV